MVSHRYSGMDISAIRRLAASMDERALFVERRVESVNSKVLSLNWRGEDREAFVAEWESNHVPRLRSTISGLRHGADLARKYAADQERVSRI